VSRLRGETVIESCVFDAAVGRSVAAAALAKVDYLIDPSRFSSEGNWAFCRFSSAEVPAARLGFQRGGFNAGSAECVPSREYLQLHLELMTQDGAILWVPSGIYPASSVRTDPQTMDIELEHDGKKLFGLRGWPKIDCHFHSADGDAQADLKFDLHTVTVLPDCLLPHCVFGMWESMGEVSGSVRTGNRSIEVAGKVFFDHPRVIARRHFVVARQMYIYTTLYFEDGSGVFGYYSADVHGQPIDEYCFGVYLAASGDSRLLPETNLTHLELDEDRIASGWRLRWRTANFCVRVEVFVEPSRILRRWGTPDAPQERAKFSIIPLVLQARAEIVDGATRWTLQGHGLAEYFNADLWPPDAAAATVEMNS
jgi:hypothetical protein